MQKHLLSSAIALLFSSVLVAQTTTWTNGHFTGDLTVDDKLTFGTTLSVAGGLAYGEHAIALAPNAQASGKDSFLFPGDIPYLTCGAHGEGSIMACDGDSIALGYRAVAIGFEGNAYGNYSLAMGNGVYCDGSNALAFGEGCDAVPAFSVVLGCYNIPEGDSTQWVPTDPLFVLGNGSDWDDPHDALKVTKNGILMLYGDDATTPGIVLDPNTQQVFVGGQAIFTPASASAIAFNAPSLSFGTGGTPRMTIDSSGNVGIGTVSPAATLDVSGNATLGVGVTSGTSGQVVLGKYNDTRTNDSGVDHTQGVLIVGAGASSSAGANALRVLADGTLLVKKSGNLSMGAFTEGEQP